MDKPKLQSGWRPAGIGVNLLLGDLQNCEAYLPINRAGLALPCLSSRHQGDRLALLKNIKLIKRENLTIPG